MDSTFIQAPTFTITNNYGLRNDVVARVITIDNDRINHDRLFKPTLRANPGCKLLLRQRDGSFALENNEHDRHQMSIFRFAFERFRQFRAIEYKTGTFCFTVPIAICKGYNARLQCDEFFSYDLKIKAAVNFKALNEFFTTFELSQERSEITLHDIASQIKTEVEVSATQKLDQCGLLQAWQLKGLLRSLGLFMYDCSVLNYKSGFHEKIKALDEATEAKKEDLFKLLIQQKQALLREQAKTLAEVSASLAAAGVEPKDIERILRNIKQEYQEALAALESHYRAEIRRLEVAKMPQLSAPPQHGAARIAGNGYQRQARLQSTPYQKKNNNKYPRSEYQRGYDPNTYSVLPAKNTSWKR